MTTLSHNSPSIPDEEIRRELATSEAGAIAKNMPFHELVQRMRDAERCEKCGKTQVVMNIAGHRTRFKAERVSSMTHCFCRGSDVLQYVPVVTTPKSDDDVVLFERNRVRWGDLTQADRKAYSQGGYPF